MSKNKVEFKDGYYWVATSDTAKTGFATKREAKRYANDYSLTLAYVALALLGIALVLNVAVLVVSIVTANYN